MGRKEQRFGGGQHLPNPPGEVQILDWGIWPRGIVGMLTRSVLAEIKRAFILLFSPGRGPKLFPTTNIISGTP